MKISSDQKKKKADNHYADKLFFTLIDLKKQKPTGGPDHRSIIF